MENKFGDRFAGERLVESIQEANSAAVRLMAPEAASTFRLEEEPSTLRDRYGRNLFGQGCLLSRRLIEKGVACVEVALHGWDTHQENFPRVARLTNTLDQGFATLLEDLSDRGLIEDTIVVCLGEFGRTPQINRNAGRDHWPHAWTAVLAGGVNGGQIVGTTTPDGMAADDRPVTVPDLIATLFRAAGVDPRKQNKLDNGRPIRLADPEAEPVAGVSNFEA
jgi:uncharacterized protein (DUF1501 family)